MRVFITFLLILCGMTGTLQASHIMGGALTYKYLGNNKYEVNLSFYRDCSKPSNTRYPSSLTLFVKGKSTGYEIKKVMEMSVYPKKLSSSISACMGISSFCSEVAYYKIIIELWDGEEGFHLWVTEPQRNEAILNYYSGGNMIWYTTIPPKNIINSSPNVVKDAVPFLCAGRKFTFNAGFYDPDGDSLVFSFVPPYGNGSGPSFGTIQQSYTYSLQRPFGISQPEIEIDKNTGLISGLSGNTGNFVIVVKVDEYRRDPKTNEVIFLGQVRIDLQFVLLNCFNNNNPPSWDEDTAGVVRHIKLGDSLLITVSGHDEDEETLKISAYGSMLGSPSTFPKPWAVFKSDTGYQSASATLTWFPGCEHINTPHVVTFKLEDENCNSVEKSYLIYVDYDIPPDVKIDLGKDKGICSGDSIVLDAGFDQVLWSDGTSGRYCTVWEEGLVWAYYSPLSGCKITKVADDIYITKHKKPVPLKDRRYVVCPGDTSINSGGESGQSYKWSTGDQTKYFNADHSGIYTVEISNAYCTITDSVEVIQVTPAFLDLGPDFNICAGDKVTLDAHLDEVSWDNGSVGRFRTVDRPGVYKVYFSALPQCQLTDSITVSPAPAPKKLPQRQLQVCGWDSLIDSGGDENQQYKWSTGDTTKYFRPTGPGVYYVHITYGTCSILDSVTVVETNVLPMDLGSDTLVCRSPWILDAVYQSAVWQDGTIGHYYPAYKTGRYHATFLSDQGCQATDTINLTVIKFPKVNLGEDRKACSGDLVELKVGEGAADYWWSTGESTPNIYVSAPGKYWVTATNKFCSLSDTVIINFVHSPVSELPREVSICYEDDEFVNLNGGIANKYLWWPGNEETKTLLIMDTGVYKVTLYNNNGCFTTDSVLVKNYCAGTLFIPNVFTPDHNSRNEVFMAKGTYVRSFSMKIYNRWGELLFESDDINKGWDGTFKGKPVPEGEYLFSVRAKLQNDNVYRSGTFTLLR